MALEYIPNWNPAQMSARTSFGGYSVPEEQLESILMVRRVLERIRKVFWELAGNDSETLQKKNPKFLLEPENLFEYCRDQDVELICYTLPKAKGLYKQALSINTLCKTCIAVFYGRPNPGQIVTGNIKWKKTTPQQNTINEPTNE